MAWITLIPERFRDKCCECLNHRQSGDSSKRVSGARLEAEAWGRYAEAITVRYLLSQGLPIREWGWRPGKGKGEIDIISQRGNRIIFVEVKARNGINGDPWDAITPSKIRDICHGADIYLKMQKESFEYQFDVALITGNSEDYKFDYIEDAFLCPLRGTAYRR